ncbi:MAG: hypothetical protein M3N91_08570 [Pseudomonadota bacterium]|nr:hypothetical protein [Pseudomonadota bacterium]
MKTLNNLATLSLSLILGLMPFAVIVLNDSAVAKTEVVTVDALNPGHALGMERALDLA